MITPPPLYYFKASYTENRMFLKFFCLCSIFVIFKLESISADPLAKEVIRAMDKVISDHVEWDNWEAWSKIMEEVLYYHLVRIIII